MGSGGIYMGSGLFLAQPLEFCGCSSPSGQKLVQALLDDITQVVL